MIYYQDETVIIRDICPEDAERFPQEECKQGWHSTPDKFLRRLKDQAEGKSISMVAEYLGNVAGYINVYPDCAWGPFGNQGLPEIVDFAVLEKYRRIGIGRRLMDTAEQIAAQHADTVYIGVGLHSGYGSAQRMYVKRGYLPDGSGVWYKNAVCAPYADCCNDDDLVLYFSKPVRAQEGNENNDL